MDFDRASSASPDLAEAIRRGAAPVWDDPPYRPTLKRVPLELVAPLREDPEGLREILRRAAIFRKQVQAFVRRGGAIPLLTLPGHDWQGLGNCVSCGDPTDPERWRCSTCLAAVMVAGAVSPSALPWLLRGPRLSLPLVGRGRPSPKGGLALSLTPS